MSAATFTTPIERRAALSAFTSLCILGGLGACAFRQAAARSGAPPPQQTGTPTPAIRMLVGLEYGPPLRACPVVRASVNGRAPSRWLFDTGTVAGLLVEGSQASRLGLKLTGQPLTARGVAGAGVVRRALPCTFQLLSRQGASPPLRSSPTFRVEDAAVGDLASMFGPGWSAGESGMIGSPLVADLTARMDTAAGTLLLTSEGKAPAPGALTVPVVGREGHYFATLSLGAAGVRTLVDTGSPDTVLPARIIAGLRPAAASAHDTRDHAHPHRLMFLLPELRLGPLVARDVVVGECLPSEEPRLGMELLSRFVVTFDFPHERMVVEKRVGAQAPAYQQAVWAARLSQRGKRWFVGAFPPGSPAEAAGVRVGDELLQIDSRRVQDLPGTRVQAYLDGSAGTTAHLALLRAAQAVRVRYVRAGAFPPPISAGSHGAGLYVSGVPGTDFLFVERVAPGSAAAEAGLQPGDRLMAVGGRPVTAAALAELAQLVNAPNGDVVLLRVLPLGQETPRGVRVAAPRRGAG